MAATATATESETSRLRVPPSSVEAERAVLGGLMLDASGWDRVADRIREEDFYRRDHQLVFRAIAALIDANHPCDVLTVSEWLDAQGGDAKVEGGLAYVGELAESTPSAANVAAYADIVRERAVLREMIAAGSAIADRAYRTEGRPARELVEEAEQLVYAIGDRRRSASGPEPIREVLVGVMERLDELHHVEGHITGVPTGFIDLDRLTAGLQRGDLIVVAGRPSMGKTALALNLVEGAAIRSKLAAVVFSMEMSSEQLTMRFMSSLGRIDAHKIRTGKLDDADWPRLTTAMTMLNESKIFLDDSGDLTPTELRARCRRLKREHDVGIVVVDYLQLMHVPGTSENRATEISEISRSLKALARELEVPVVALSQLNRSLETRANRRPMLSDLRESGAIEQDADVILFIYRDEVYNPDSADKGVAEIIISKQRNGPTGMVQLTFTPHLTKFDNHIDESTYGYEPGAGGVYDGPPDAAQDYGQP